MDEISRVVSTLQSQAPAVRKTGPAEREAKLERLMDALGTYQTQIQEALHADFRKCPIEVDLTEVKAVIDEAQHAIDHLATWMQPTPVSTPTLFTGTHSSVQYEPKGVVLIMAPWNYPVNLTLGPLVGAIAAGNCAVLKPSEHAPHTAALIRDLVDEVYDDREISVVTGGPDVAKALTHQPFDHIYFTGSPAIGRRVMRAAASHLTSVTLELGGKSPAVVDDSTDLEEAARRIAWCKFTNAGQTCIAPDYVLVHERAHAPLLKRLQEAIHAFYGPTPRVQRETDDYARLIHADHFDTIIDLLQSALEAGASVAAGGEHDRTSQYVAPTLLTDVPLDTAIMQKEIFGPLLPVIPFGSLDEALQIVDDRPPPLSLYLFSEREETIDSVLSDTTAGSTCVNEGFLHFNNPALPFGGKGESGIGRGHGVRGFQAFSNERAVLRRAYGTRLVNFFYPPYDGRTRRFVDWVLRFF